MLLVRYDVPIVIRGMQSVLRFAVLALSVSFSPRKSGRVAIHCIIAIHTVISKVRVLNTRLERVILPHCQYSIVFCKDFMFKIK